VPPRREVIVFVPASRQGIENQAQFDFLRFQGCDEFQGYLISRPLPAEVFQQLGERGGQC
jgi:EAL domain-containing protein (putative c-di-GMP-specific phosphodiesterase class I)